MMVKRINITIGEKEYKKVKNDEGMNLSGFVRQKIKEHYDIE